MNTPLSAYFSYCELSKQLKTKHWKDIFFDEEVVHQQGDFNAAGTAKGQKIDVKEWSRLSRKLKNQETLNKTLFNMQLSWEQRTEKIFNQQTLQSYPIQKKEVTKVRYIINTDLNSHYQFAPIESLLVKSNRGGSVYNCQTELQQQQLVQSWLHSDRLRFCAD